MPTFRLTSPRDFVGVNDRKGTHIIPKGYILQVPSRGSSRPSADEVKSALLSQGFNESVSAGYQSPGNWKIEKM